MRGRLGRLIFGEREPGGMVFRTGPSPEDPELHFHNTPHGLIECDRWTIENLEVVVHRAADGTVVGVNVPGSGLFQWVGP